MHATTGSEGRALGSNMHEMVSSYLCTQDQRAATRTNSEKISDMQAAACVSTCNTNQFITINENEALVSLHSTKSQQLWFQTGFFNFPRIPGAVLREQRGDLRPERGGTDPAGGGRGQTARRHGEEAGGRPRHRRARPNAEVGRGDDWLESGRERMDRPIRGKR